MLPELEAIAKKRKLLNLTQHALSRAAGVPQPTLTKIERGRVKPSYRTAKKLFDILEKLEHKNEPRARDSMQTGLVTLTPGDSIKTAVALMKKHAISQIPVCDQGRVTGTATDSSILFAGKDPSLPISAAAEGPLPQVSTYTTLTTIRAILKEHHAVLLLTKTGRLAGIITKEDLL